MLNSFGQKIADFVVALLRQGATPRQLALSLAIGVCIGCFPLFGVTTLFCTVAALSLRLNLAAMQLANHVCAPLQIILWIPFIRLGEQLFRTERLPLAPKQLIALFRDHPWHALHALWMWEWHAIAVWLLVAPVGCLLLTVILHEALRRVPLFPTEPQTIRAD